MCMYIHAWIYAHTHTRTHKPIQTKINLNNKECKNSCEPLPHCLQNRKDERASLERLCRLPWSMSGICTLCRRKQPIGKWHTVNKWLCAFVILSSGPPLSLTSSLLSYLTYLSLPMGQDDILTSSSDFYMCHAQLYTHGHAYMPLLYGHCSLHPSILNLPIHLSI